VPHEVANPIFYLTFTNNFDFILHGHPDATSLELLWSVAIEEQFYLLWPIVIFLCPLRKLWIPFLSIVFCSLLFRAFNDTWAMHERHTLSCIGDMAVGAGGAWLVQVSERFKNFVTNLKTYQIGVLYIVFMEIYFFRGPLLFSHFGVRIFERVFIAIIFLFIILEQTYSRNSLFKMSNFRRVTKLGGITYGLYCLHIIAILITINLTGILKINQQLWQIFFVDTVIAFIISIILGKMSFKYFESPFLRLKNKISFITR
jgi:peptidoglycan/LPS O-acetylase OafA/YrhL